MNKDKPLVVENLHKQFGKVEAVHSLSITVKPGEVLGIIGPNGAGKTTSIKMILGLLEPDSGSVRLFGENSSNPEIRTLIGYLPENPSFYRYLTGRELLHFAGALFSQSKRDCKLEAERLLQLVGLGKAADRQLGGYSKGMLQRICLAQALINQPRLLFLDEPLDGLDPIGRVQMREILLDLKSQGTAIVFSSHILSDVELISSRIAIMSQGRIVQTGSVKEIVPAGQNLETVFIQAVGKEQE